MCGVCLSYIRTDLGVVPVHICDCLVDEARNKSFLYSQSTTSTCAQTNALPADLQLEEVAMASQHSYAARTRWGKPPVQTSVV